MSAVEALASGVPVIAPPVGWMPELPHIEYPVGDADALRTLLVDLVGKRHQLREEIADRTWVNFASAHESVFSALVTDAR